MWLRSLPNIKAQAQVTILMQRYCPLVAGKHSRTIRDSGSIIMAAGLAYCISLWENIQYQLLLLLFTKSQTQIQDKRWPVTGGVNVQADQIYKVQWEFSTIVSEAAAKRICILETQNWFGIRSIILNDNNVHFLVSFKIPNLRRICVLVCNPPAFFALHHYAVSCKTLQINCEIMQTLQGELLTLKALESAEKV